MKKRNGKLLLSLLALGFLLSCTQAPKQIVHTQVPKQIVHTQVPKQIGEKERNSTVLLLVPADDDIPIGSGFFVEPDKIATNIHVIAGKTGIRAKLAGTKQSYSIEGVTVFDLKNDLAILKVTGEGIPLALGNGRIGEAVFGVGYPLEGEYKVTKSIIHSIRESDRLVRMTAKLSPGNSGGPVLNSSGKVIGVAVRARDNSSQAISSNALEALLARSGKAEALTKWQRRKPVQAYKHFAKGNYMNLEQALDAIKKYDKAIELYPSFVEAYSSRGEAKNNLGQYLEAIKDYNTTIEFIPDHAFAHRNRGKAWSNLGRYKAAIKDFNEALKVMPDHAFTYLNRGFAWYRLDNYKAAIKDFDKAIKLNPADAFTYNYRGAAWFHLGNYKAAIEDFDKAMGLNPADASAYNYRGAAWSRLGNYKAAIKDFDKAIKLNPADASVYNNRGSVWNQLGKSETKLGNAEKAQKYNEAAKADFEKAKELDPEVGK